LLFLVVVLLLFVGSNLASAQAPAHTFALSSEPALDGVRLMAASGHGESEGADLASETQATKKAMHHRVSGGLMPMS